MREVVSPSVRKAREVLARRRKEVRRAHREGAPGHEVAAALTRVVDAVVRERFRAHLYTLPSADRERLREGLALVALGGYGRIELAPHSDIDLMFLYRPRVRVPAEEVAKGMIRDLWDVGLQLGSSLRTLRQCLSLARRDATVFTALLGARLVAGRRIPFEELRKSVGGLCGGRRSASRIRAVLAQRTADEGGATFRPGCLEPDVKSSRGGLRDIHLIGWIACCRHGTADLKELQKRELLSADEVRGLAGARSFLLRIRIDLHFQAGRSQDCLTLNEQLRLAPSFGFLDQPGRLAAEQFMQLYHHHSRLVESLCRRFVKRSLREPLWRRVGRSLFTHRLEGHYRVFGDELRIAPEAEPELLSRPEGILRIFEVAGQAGAGASEGLQEKIRGSLQGLEGADFAEARGVFLRILNRPGSLSRTLRRLHHLGLLERLVPEFRPARGLVPLSRLDSWAVDEHALRCVEAAERFRHAPGRLGTTYRQIQQKDILHLALLIHDLGKAREGDHREEGRRIAGETAERFGLDPHRRDLLVFLVHRHGLMARLALRRDTADERLLAGFAREVGTPEVLRLLYVLTVADLVSAEPGSWGEWKTGSLEDLFNRTLEALGGERVLPDPEGQAARVRAQVLEEIGSALPEEWSRRHLEAMPLHYLLGTPAERIAEDLLEFWRLVPEQLLVTTRCDPRKGITEYSVYTRDTLTEGLFYKITGTLAARGLQIVGAQIATYGDGLVVDRFQVIDPDHPGSPTEERREEIAQAIRSILLGHRRVEELFSRRLPPPPRSLSLQEPSEVRVDNETSERFTILDVFAPDRQGLLYVIARTLFELGLSVSLARITTRLGQILDVFYVTDNGGAKITDGERLEEIRRRVIEALERSAVPAADR